MKVQIIINSIGLFLDVIGFIGLFFHKIKEIELKNNIGFLSRVRSETPNIQQTAQDIFDSLNRSLKEFYKKNKALDRSSWPYFTLIILGFVFQFISQFF